MVGHVRTSPAGSARRRGSTSIADREDQLEDVGDAHMRSSHRSSANNSAKNTAVIATISTSSIPNPLSPKPLQG